MSQNGLVAFFDILGYQDIINNNLIDDVAKLISKIILGLPEDAKKVLLANISGKNREGLELCYSKINARIVSDSIIIFLEVSPNRTGVPIGLIWVVFLTYVADLFLKAFDQGLPLRGAVDYGDFFLTEQCFAGKPIVDCYRLSNDLEFAGCVLSKNAESHVLQFSDHRGESSDKMKMVEDFLDFRLMTYLVPLKKTEERMFLIDWCHNITNNATKDIRQYVVNQFKAHNKDISEKVMRKLNNTEIMLRCLRERYINKEPF